MILLHLLQYIDVPVSGYVMPHAMTQQGIGLAAGMSRAHVSNCMTEMREKGLVDSVYTHPKGTTSRMRAYYLLPSGIEAILDLAANWERPYLKRCEFPDRNLLDRMLAAHLRKLPEVYAVDKRNVDEIATKSAEYRKKIIGRP